MKRVLLTGHGGFVGHHCLEYLLKHTDWEFICIDSFRHKGTCRRVVEIEGDLSRVKTFKHDLSVPFDDQLISLIFERTSHSEKPIDYIFNLASESAVERSTQDPVGCIRNNFEIALNMLEFARKCKNLELFVQFSTDEVYGEAPPFGSHKEWDMMIPSNPYAASKAGQEMLAIGYFRTYNLPIIIVNTMNMIGERQNPEKFLPKIIQKISLGEEVPIYGDSPKSIGSRVYLHAKNAADSLIFLSHIKPTLYSDYVKNGRSYEAKPDRYNICGNVELNNLDMAQRVASIMGQELKYRLIPSESARPGYDRRYMLDGTKIREMGWTEAIPFDKSLKLIVDWTLKNPHWVF
jgi:dTDP-glucose 4,6-dehydratase